MQLTLIRHTTPQQAAGICYGRSEIALASSFEDDLREVQAKLGRFEATFSSPSRRCTQLAQGLGWATCMADVRLMELDFGAWERTPWAEIPRDELDTWGADYVDRAPPRGESFAQLHARCVSWLDEIHAAHAGQGVAVVTHAGVIRALLAEALGLPLKDVFRFQVDYGSITLIDFGQTLPVVAYVNR